MADMHRKHLFSADAIPAPAALVDPLTQSILSLNEEMEEWLKGNGLSPETLLKPEPIAGYDCLLRRKQLEDGTECLLLINHGLDPSPCKESKSAIYQSLIQNTPTSVLILNVNGLVLEMNASFQSLFGLTDGIIHQSFYDLVELHEPSFIHLVKEGLKGHDATGEEVRFHAGGRELTCTITVSPIDYKCGGCIDSVGIIFHDITEKKNAQAELVLLQTEMENILRLQKAITYKVVRYGHDFVIELASGKMLSRLDLTPQRMNGKRIEDVFDKVHLKKIRPKLEAVWAKGEEYTYEDAYKGLEYLASIVPVKKDGQVVEAICSISDISLMKDIQRQLAESEEKYKSIVKYSPDHILMVDTYGFIQSVNPAVYEHWGYGFSDLVNRHYTSLFAEESQEDAVENFQIALNGTSSRYLAIVRDGKGKERRVTITNIPIRVRGQVIGIYGFGQDVTEKLNMEDELMEAKELLEAYFEHSGDGIVLLDPTGRVLKVNQRFEDMFGWTNEEIVGDVVTFLHRSDQYHQFQKNLEVVKAGKRIKDQEALRYRKDQTSIEISFNMNPILNNEGSLIGISAIIRDLSEKKHHENLLKKSEQLAMIGQLAAGVAHEIRNPLTTLKGFLQLMDERKEDDFYLTVIKGELDRIEIITNEFLALARPRAVQFSLTSLTRLLTSSVDFIKMECLKQGVDVRFAVEEAQVYCDSNQMKQVILNVMKNALEAMQDGGLLNVQLENDGHHAKISIQDNGSGIPPERMKHLGEPFYSTKEKGTGLGLMICQKIIKEHNGSLSIQSNLEEGTSVDILLPLASLTHQ
ncbi:PAS domain S-box protein [Rossellomorea marisflavi]|uniref:PAS domain-containing protein n=1 Tax=Rossellomorea marisflavi TaxID=189381 RepID=UPI0025AFEF18|nr:PAS domain S-box protein [Rossellomorea marisflavi]WJV18374.1 PAS domain S-box protein [Rossellomorea marisflavi]